MAVQFAQNRLASFCTAVLDTVVLVDKSQRGCLNSPARRGRLGGLMLGGHRGKGARSQFFRAWGEDFSSPSAASLCHLPQRVHGQEQKC